MVNSSQLVFLFLVDRFETIPIANMSRSIFGAVNVTASQATALKGVIRNSSYVIPGVYDLSTEDTNWVLTSSFIIFTMQTGKYWVEPIMSLIRNSSPKNWFKIRPSQ